MLRESARRLKQGKNLLIFPEGTRSKGDKMNEVQDGITAACLYGEGSDRSDHATALLCLR